MKTLNDDPTYQAATQKLAELQAQRADIEQQLRDASAASGESQLSEIDRAALALLDGRAVDAGDDARDKLTEQVRVFDRAIEMQRQTVDAERSRVSVEICQAALPAHRVNVAKVSRALAALATAAAEEATLREKLHQADVSLGAVIRPMAVVAGRIRDVGDLVELAANYAAEARANGLAS